MNVHSSCLSFLFEAKKIIIVFINLLYHGSGFGYKICADEFSCFNESLVTSDYIDCYGFASCAGSNINSSNTIDCDASKSCMSSKQLVLTGNYYLWSEGYLSTAFTDKIIATNGVTMKFNGEGSGYNINNITLSNNTKLKALGYRSLENSSIFTFDNDVKIDGYGSLSLMNANIYVYNKAKIELLGYYAGYNTKIFCNMSINSECNVTCVNTGCYNTYVFCDDNNDCLVSCDDASGVSCPLYNNYNDSYSTDVYRMKTISNFGLVLSMDEYSNSFNNSPCTNDYDFNNYQESLSTIVQASNGNNVCCNGGHSCESSVIFMSDGGIMQVNAASGIKSAIVGGSQSIIKVQGRGIYQSTIVGFNITTVCIHDVFF